MPSTSLNRDLHFRFNFCRFCITVLSEVEDTDPRKVDALRHYNQQLQTISDQIKAETGKPPDIVVGLKPGILFPKAEGV